MRVARPFADYQGEAALHGHRSEPRAQLREYADVDGECEAGDRGAAGSCAGGFGSAPIPEGVCGFDDGRSVGRPYGEKKSSAHRFELPKSRSLRLRSRQAFGSAEVRSAQDDKSFIDMRSKDEMLDLTTIYLRFFWRPWLWGLRRYRQWPGRYRCRAAARGSSPA